MLNNTSLNTHKTSARVPLHFFFALDLERGKLIVTRVLLKFVIAKNKSPLPLTLRWGGERNGGKYLWVCDLHSFLLKRNLCVCVSSPKIYLDIEIDCNSY